MQQWITSIQQLSGHFHFLAMSTVCSGKQWLFASQHNLSLILHQFSSNKLYSSYWFWSWLKISRAVEAASELVSVLTWCTQRTYCYDYSPGFRQHPCYQSPCLLFWHQLINILEMNTSALIKLDGYPRGQLSFSKLKLSWQICLIFLPS